MASHLYKAKELSKQNLYLIFENEQGNKIIEWNE